MEIIPSVVCYIKNEKGEFLFLKRNHQPDLGRFVPPGGKIEEGEDPLSCVKREIKEETGLDVEEIKYKGTAFHYGEREEWIVFVFYAERFKGKLVEGGEGPLIWVREEEVPLLNMPPGDKYLLEYVFSDTPFFATFWYNREEGLIDHKIWVVR